MKDIIVGRVTGAVHRNTILVEIFPGRETPLPQVQPGGKDPFRNAGIREGTMKRIVLIAHDTKRKAMIRWLRCWRGELSEMALYVAGPFGRKPVGDLGLTLHPVVSGSDGENIDPGAVLAMAEQYDVPTALNPWTADYVSSLLLGRVRRTPRRMAV